MTEAEIQAGVLQGLAARRIFAWRNNTGSLPDANGRRVSFGLLGSADIIGMLPGGRFLAIECKAPLGRQSIAQRRFEQAVNANHGVYLVARDVDLCLSRVDAAIAIDAGEAFRPASR